MHDVRLKRNKHFHIEKCQNQIKVYKYYLFLISIYWTKCQLKILILSWPIMFFFFKFHYKSVTSRTQHKRFILILSFIMQPQIEFHFYLLIEFNTEQTYMQSQCCVWFKVKMEWDGKELMMCRPSAAFCCSFSSEASVVDMFSDFSTTESPSVFTSSLCGDTRHPPQHEPSLLLLRCLWAKHWFNRGLINSTEN